MEVWVVVVCGMGSCGEVHKFNKNPSCGVVGSIDHIHIVGSIDHIHIVLQPYKPEPY